MSLYDRNSEPLWKPSDNGRFSRVEVFRRFVNRKQNLQLKDYHDLHKYSVENWHFWQDLWEFIGVVYSVPPKQVIHERPQKEVPEFFPGARLNYAENMLKYNDDGIAITAVRETGSVGQYTHKQLRNLVRDMSNALRAHGIKPKDRIAAVITNSIHAVVLALAAATVGAMFSTTAPDMGAHGILDRYRQITPKLLFFDTEISYAGKRIDLTDKIQQVAQDLKSRYELRNVVLIPSTISGRYLDKSIPHSVTMDDFLAKGAGGKLEFEQLPFNHPFWILYSSGTTGPPKCIVHSAGGTMMQGIKDAVLSYNMGQGDCYLQYTTTAWMMFAVLVCKLMTGARIVTYDGSPFFPSPQAFLKLVNDQGISLFGISPRYIAELQGVGIKPVEEADFPSLRAVLVTGAVLTAPVYHWIYKAFPPYVHLISSSGGTDVCTAFVTGSPCLPVYAEEMQVKCLGMKVEVFDPQGRNIEHTGQPGELVCTRAHPSLPLYFWNDKDGKKYESAYFATYPDIWTQGDFMVVNPLTKGIRILGRSDGVLNPSGVRFGPSEIYGALERFRNKIDDSICIGQRRPHDIDERVLLFVKMLPGCKLTPELEKEMRSVIRTLLSKRHEPAYIFEVPEIPYTVNNKKIEIAVKQIVSGVNVKPSATVANSESLNHYYKYYELEKLVGQGVTKLMAKL